MGTETRLLRNERHHRDGVNSQKGIEMTEMVHGEGQNSNFAPAPVNTPSPTPNTPTDSERTFRQSEVNDLVGRAKHEAIERYKRETSMPSHTTHQVYQPPQQQQQPYQPPQQQGYQQPQYQPQQPSMSQDEVRRMAAEEANRAREQWTQDSQRNAQEQQASQIASEFFTKIETGKANLPNF